MRIELEIKEQVSDGIFSASGTCFSERVPSTDQWPIETLVKAEGKKTMLHLDKDLKPSLMGGKEVLAFILDEPVNVQAKPGAKLTFEKVSINLKVK